MGLADSALALVALGSLRGSRREEALWILGGLIQLRCLAGERFREEADRLEERLWGVSGRKTGTKSSVRLQTRQPRIPQGRIVPRCRRWESNPHSPEGTGF